MSGLDCFLLAITPTMHSKRLPMIRGQIIDCIGYFLALQDPRFAPQGGASFFVLEYQNWAIIGLNSAYDANSAQYSTECF